MIPINMDNFVYDKQKQIITAVFGRPTTCVYKFYNVPAEIVDRIRSSENQADEFNRLIRGEYRSKRIL